MSITVAELKVRLKDFDDLDTIVLDGDAHDLVVTRVKDESQVAVPVGK